MVATNGTKGVGSGRQKNGAPKGNGGPDEGNYGKRARWDASSVMNIPDPQREWGFFPVPEGVKEIRRIVEPRPEEHSAERALANTAFMRLYDERFKTALIVHPSKATYASAAGAGAIILYLPGASCVHSQATAMLYQLGFFGNKGYPGVAIDHAFHGSGPREEMFYNLTPYMAWIHSIVQYSNRLYAGVPIGIFGRSFGANIALEFATRYPGEAAFIVAMSGYHPQWTPFSIFEIDKMVEAGKFSVNVPGLQWVKKFDPQWTWQLSRSRDRIRRNNVLIMAGDRDTEYPWHPWQLDTVANGKIVVKGNYARGFGVPPEGTPEYVKYWQKFAPTVGAEFALFPGGEHNLFDGNNVAVARRAEKSVLDYLGRIVPAAGKHYYVGRPYHFSDTVLELPASLDKLRDQAADMENILVDHPANVRGELYLALLYKAMSHMPGVHATVASEYKERAASKYAQAFQKIAGEARMLLLGRPIDDKVVQAAVRDALHTAHPFDLIPQTPSVREFAAKVHGMNVKGVEGVYTTLVHGTLYDFMNRPMEVCATVAEGMLKTITLRGDDETLATAMEHWQHNARMVTGKVADSHEAIELHEARNEAGVRYLSLGRAEGREVPDEVVLARFMELFFQYYPHSIVRDFVARVDAHEHWVGMDPADVHLSQFAIVREGDRMLVRTRPSDETDGTALSLVDLQHIIEHQERKPNGPAFRGRRDDASRPAGTLRVDQYPALHPSSTETYVNRGFLSSLVGVPPPPNPLIAVTANKVN